MSNFRNGFNIFVKNSSIANGVYVSKTYIDSVEYEIFELEKNINKFKGFGTPNDKLKGNIAEFWHSGTFNIKAAVEGSTDRTEVLQSNGFASVDIGSNFGKDFGLKYYNTAPGSVKQQSKSYFESYSKYISDKKNSNREIESFLEYLEQRGIDESTVLKHDPIYQGQIRIIPTEQLDEAKVFLERKILEESNKRPELVEKYQETLDLLTDKVSNNEGVQSIELTNEEAEKIAQISKDGDFNGEDYDLTTEELIHFNNVMSQALKAGLTAAVITTILKTTPELIKIITKYLKEEHVSIDDFKELGLTALSGAAEGFIRGTIAAAITISAKSGLLGKNLKTVDPTMIGTVVAVSMNIIQNSILLASNKVSKQDFAYECTRDLFVTTGGMVTGAIFAMVPGMQVYGFLLGNFLGSIISSFVYEAAHTCFMSLCIDTGFTCFGFVDQNYTLPDNVLKNLGIELFEYEKMDVESFEFNIFEVSTFDFQRFDYCSIEFQFLQRGVIGVNRIAYLN